jgi:pyruvate,water dikinase
LIPLNEVEECHERVVGGKAAKLGQLIRAGFSVPNGFCLTTLAYETFVDEHKIVGAIQMELGRKSMDDMRWEEIWDAALRIRSRFVSQPLSDHLSDAIAEGLQQLGSPATLAIRSSAVGEDSPGRSFAGVHESIVGASGTRAVEDALRVVWASLWSDAALLYRKELGLDPLRSRMAVVVQEMVHGDRSGVAFGRDPRDTRKDHAVIESVPGPCSLLVDGVVDPDRWELNRKTGSVITFLPGQRENPEDDQPLLQPCDLQKILETLLSVEQLFRWSPDMEWIGRSDSLTVLQARPITTALPDKDETRRWYLTLRPGDNRLKQLRQRVAEELIPKLVAEGQALASEQLDLLDDQQLAVAIESRSEAFAKWKKIYWDEFIPFAHGVRRLATYYNDAVQPEDPYEFVGLLRHQPLLASQRNQVLGELAKQLAANDSLRRAVDDLLTSQAATLRWPKVREYLRRTADEAEDFVQGFEGLNEQFLDIAYDGERLKDEPEPLLRNLLELSCRPDQATVTDDSVGAVSALEHRLLNAVRPDQRQEAIDMIETARVSWRLRDDDNLLVARLESQLLRALKVAARRLQDQERLIGNGHVSLSHAELLVRALRESITAEIRAETQAKLLPQDPAGATEGETPRQLIGQPASPGVATATVRCIQGREDLGKFRHGEVLVCDAIQPTMTHLVPLASAIVERRGGMLIHGAILARELGIPCVNGVRKAADVLRNGDLVTVDGHLGIVTVGSADFDLELRG